MSEHHEAAEIERKFKVATTWIRDKTIKFPMKPSNRQSLFFYGRYKQAVKGDNTDSKPGIWNPIRGYMWAAHEKNKGKSKTQAMREYVEEIEKLAHDFDVEKNLPPHLIQNAERFFTEYYNTARHPFRAALRKLNGLPEEKPEEERKEQAPQSPLSSPSQAQQLQDAAVRSPANLHLPPPSSPAPRANGLGSQHHQSDAASPSSSPTTVAAGAAENGHLHHAVPVAGTVAAGAENGHQHLPHHYQSASAQPAPSSPAAISSELADRELLAARLVALQQANQTKLAALERHVAALNSRASAAAGAPRAAASFATPSTRGFQPPAAPSSASAAHTSSFAPNQQSLAAGGVLDPSSPFVASWSSGGLAAASPLTPAFQTPYTQSRPAREMNGIRHTPIPFGGVNSSPVRSARSPPFQPRSPGLAATPSSPSSSVSSGDMVPRSTVDAMLDELNRRHEEQVAHFKAAEERWQQTLAEMEETARRTQEIIANSVGSVSAASASPAIARKPRDPALQLTVSVEQNSIASQLINGVKIAVPVGLSLYAAFKLYQQYQRKWRRN